MFFFFSTVLNKQEYHVILNDTFKHVFQIWKSIGFDKQVAEIRAGYFKNYFNVSLIKI